MKSLKLVKSGDTFEISCSLEINFGNSISSIKSQLKTDEGIGILIQTMTISAPVSTSTTKTWTISATSAETTAWPNKRLKMDIQLTSTDGKIISTEVFSVPVTKGSTI